MMPAQRKGWAKASKRNAGTPTARTAGSPLNVVKMGSARRKNATATPVVSRAPCRTATWAARAALSGWRATRYWPTSVAAAVIHAIAGR